MKKIFTLIFSMGLLTAAFAQDGHQHRDNNRDNAIVNQNGYQNHVTAKSYGTTSYSQSWNSQPTSRNEDRYDNGFKRSNNYGFDNNRRDWSDGQKFNDNRSYTKMHHYKPRKSNKHVTGLQLTFSFGR